MQNGYRPITTQSNRPYATRFNEDKILERFVNALSKDFLPFTMIVNETLDITHIFGDAQKYLTYPSGKLITDVTKLVNKDLSIPIATGIRKALKSNESINLSNIKIREKEQARSMNIQIRLLPGRKGQETLIAILILEADHSPYEYLPSADTFDINQDAAQRINDLEHELQLTRENLQATVEELETSNEELQATNEELLASNEELQSTNEELQSVNEELYTVNAEHQSKITELTILNNDLDNLFNSTNIGILFLDENLDIRRFTHKLQSLFHIVDNDIGRPFFHLTHSIKNIHLDEQIYRVIEKKTIHEQEIQTQHGNWFFMRIIPYAVSDTIFAGVILTFVNIDLLKQTQDNLEIQAKEEMHRLASFVNYSLDAMSLQDTAGNIITWNRGAEHLYGWTEKEALQMRFEELIPLTDRPGMHQIVTMLHRGETIPQFESRRITKQGEIVEVSVSSSLLYSSKETGELLALTERDLRSFHEIEKKNCINCMQRLSTLLMDVSEAIVLLDFEGKIIAWNKGAEKLYGWTQQEAITMRFEALIPEIDRPDGQLFFEKLTTGTTPYQVTQAHRLTKSKEIMTVSVIASILGYHNGETILGYHNGETMLIVTTERPIDG